MQLNDFNAGQTSEEASVIIVITVIMGVLVDNLPAVQLILYTVGILTGLGTLLLNGHKYIKKLKELYNDMKDVFSKIIRRKS